MRPARRPARAIPLPTRASMKYRHWARRPARTPAGARALQLRRPARTGRAARPLPAGLRTAKAIRVQPPACGRARDRDPPAAPAVSCRRSAAPLQNPCAPSARAPGGGVTPAAALGERRLLRMAARPLARSLLHGPCLAAARLAPPGLLPTSASTVMRGGALEAPSRLSRPGPGCTGLRALAKWAKAASRSRRCSPALAARANLFRRRRHALESTARYGRPPACTMSRSTHGTGMTSVRHYSGAGSWGRGTRNALLRGRASWARQPRRVSVRQSIGPCRSGRVCAWGGGLACTGRRRRPPAEGRMRALPAACAGCTGSAAGSCRRWRALARRGGGARAEHVGEKRGGG